MPQSAMEGHVSEGHRSSAYRRFGEHLSINLPSPLPILLESLSGLIRGRSHYSELDSGVSSVNGERVGDSAAEVAIRIIGEQEQIRRNAGFAFSHGRNALEDSSADSPPSSQSHRTMGGDTPASPSASPRSVNIEGFEGSDAGAVSNNREAVTQRYDFQPFSRWIEQVLPFTVLLLIVFVREHLQGLVVVSWVTAVMIKANDLLRKQTALKGERKTLILGGIGALLTADIAGVYWWYRKEAFWLPFFLHPPHEIPRFWEAIFIIILNDTMARQAAMIIKCGLLFFYKNRRGRDYRQQAQLLTFVEYFLLLYRALIPGPVWYRFFLNKEYGNLFSSLTTGLYLTFKLTSLLEKVKTFIVALRAVSGKEVQYGSYATAEEVGTADDLCAICQEKMHTPIALRCKHLFCEDCVSEWFERERTCPLCRAVVKSADLRSFGDGSTCLFVQLF
ncbi:hypothetical protein O6H91_20G030500 [Diphasiastrum complanatum]|uniref:Uncharacterized protein n=8 Tax=Diphasiastrum complanatum TaxID=34168 RepID=A0ACC2AP10_DIPCM|nr:hypothetical protein O6H91_20G030500 [Diphasiastrum complanatum]KAJ7519239.1 hypothetical protein O6H91_20G030500 [Diphasiastrum complanatum]KAJ7519240.1 hypothetical protein O6H91_20G030500 [Diphasiastrum complanatum]KAJ7519241.1 hypothetical protein O6H91_20G030500 [Diphasiastrum complanatum]KAJ7519242.1 hypothetical protein O6H91_20G030500 [Diphasiastrum complanatum]